MKKIITPLMFVVLSACSSMKMGKDKYLWLEEIEGQKALEWSTEQNKKSLEKLATSKEFQKMEKEALKILEAKDKIPSAWIQGKHLYNFWQDDKHVRGLLRRTSYNSYKSNNPRWESVLDVDALAKKENENWVYKGMECLDPDYKLCLIRLSRGGKDAVVIREFDLENKKFVTTNGFITEEAKTFTAWADENHLLIGTDFGKGSLTDSGYPRIVKLWKRGTPLSQAKKVYETKKEDVLAMGIRYSHQKVNTLVITRAIDFFNTEEFVFNLSDQSVKEFPKPYGAQIEGYFKGYFIYLLRNPWTFKNKKYNTGDLLAIHSAGANRKLTKKDVQLIFSPTEDQSYKSLATLKDHVVLSVLEDVKGKILQTGIEGNQWQAPVDLKLPSNGDIKLYSSTDDADMFFYFYESFDRPSALYSYEFGKGSLKLKSMPPRFNAKNLEVEQKFATSKDGTKVPYFIVHKKGMKLDGKNPTLLYGYGGFAISLTPSYDSLVGKLFLEKGGVYVVANIRGGGEYGPRWHQAALKENRQRAYDDFIAVAENLIATKVTTPERLAIRGRSNGGLLVGAILTQKPDLLGAVICGVPLLDMIRYSQLLAGASWMGEYGNPEESKYRNYILTYSPYQNMKADKEYPPTFIYTSTKDDRVHPGHARKMTAKMLEHGHEVYYYENMEGGHAANANLKQKAKLTAMEFTFLQQTIFKK